MYVSASTSTDSMTGTVSGWFWFICATFGLHLLDLTMMMMTWYDDADDADDADDDADDVDVDKDDVDNDDFCSPSLGLLPTTRSENLFFGVLESWGSLSPNRSEAMRAGIT
jgi:hypothetical protein